MPELSLAVTVTIAPGVAEARTEVDAIPNESVVEVKASRLEPAEADQFTVSPGIGFAFESVAFTQIELFDDVRALGILRFEVPSLATNLSLARGPTVAVADRVAAEGLFTSLVSAALSVFAPGVDPRVQANLITPDLSVCPEIVELAEADEPELSLTFPAPSVTKT